MKVTYLYGQNDIDKIENIKSMNAEDQRYLFFIKHVPSGSITSMAETDTHIYWSETIYKPYFNVKLFYKKNSTAGLTYDKKTKELKIWFGKIPNKTILDSFFNVVGVDYMNMINYSFQYMVTPGMLKKMAKGKVSTVEVYTQYLVKNLHAFKKLDTADVIRLVYSNTESYTNQYNFHSIGNMLSVAKCAKDAVEHILTNRFTISSYLINAALALNEKIDFKNIDAEIVRITELQLIKSNQIFNKSKIQNYDYNTLNDTESIDLPF